MRTPDCTILHRLHKAIIWLKKREIRLQVSYKENQRPIHQVEGLSTQRKKY